MDKNLLTAIYSLKDCLLENPDVIELNRIEQEMNNNEEIMSLCYQKDIAISLLGDIPENMKKEYDDGIKKVSLAKEKLYTHPLVKRYLDKYKIVNNIYKDIDKFLFSDFKTR